MKSRVMYWRVGMHGKCPVESIQLAYRRMLVRGGTLEEGIPEESTRVGTLEEGTWEGTPEIGRAHV